VNTTVVVWVASRKEIAARVAPVIWPARRAMASTPAAAGAIYAKGGKKSAGRLPGPLAIPDAILRAPIGTEETTPQIDSATFPDRKHISPLIQLGSVSHRNLGQ
jgi:hypothetical protein